MKATKLQQAENVILVTLLESVVAISGISSETQTSIQQACATVKQGLDLTRYDHSPTSPRHGCGTINLPFTALVHKHSSHSSPTKTLSRSLSLAKSLPDESELAASSSPSPSRYYTVPTTTTIDIEAPVSPQEHKPEYQNTVFTKENTALSSSRNSGRSRSPSESSQARSRSVSPFRQPQTSSPSTLRNRRSVSPPKANEKPKISFVPEIASVDESILSALVYSKHSQDLKAFFPLVRNKKYLKQVFVLLLSS